MKTGIISLLILIICLTRVYSSRPNVDEALKELLKELKLLENIKHKEGKENALKPPPGAHEVPSDENESGDDDDEHVNPIPASDNKPNDDKVTSDDVNDGENHDHPSDDDDDSYDDDDDVDDDDNDDSDDDEDNPIKDDAEDKHDIKLPPGAHEIPSKDDDDCKIGEECKNPLNVSNSDVDINERILLHLADTKKNSAVNGKSKKIKQVKATQNFVPPGYKSCDKATQPEIITDESGSIVSPGFQTGSYFAGLVCSWKFTAGAGKVVKISIQILDLEKSNNCTYDSLQVWDVIGDQTTQIGKFCGTTKPQELLQSSGRSLFVYFVTDGAINKGKFSFQWDIVNPLPPEPSDLACGKPAIKPDIGKKIVGGNPAIPYSWPWLISLRLVIGKKQYHICGGSIVNKNVILTAAHCCFDENRRAFDKSEFLVVAGDYDQKTSSDGPIQMSKVKYLYVHKSYNPKYSNSPNDIAAIVLETPLTFNNHIGPICLPTENPSLFSLCYATGWGKTQGTGDETILNQVRLPVVSQTVCAQNDHNGAEIIDSKLCAGFESGGGDACQGDSGGPFVCYNQLNSRWYLHGITSYGAGCGLPRRPGVYTRTNFFLSWIYQNTGVVA